MTGPRRLAWLLAAFAALAPLSAAADAAGAMRAAQAAVGQQDWAGAAAAARGAGEIGADLVEWQRLRASGGLLGDYEAFLARRPDWPGMPLLKEKGEEAVARSTDPARVIAYFGPDLPETATGALAYINALRAAGRAADAENEAFRAWTTLAFGPDEEQQILGLYGDILSVAHEVRLDRLLWQNRTSEAKRMLPRVGAGWRALAEARMALRADADGVNALIARIPPELQSDPGLAFERFDWRFRRDRNDDAAETLLAASKSPQTLGDPDAWAERRASLSRALLRDGKPKAAYRVAASNQLAAGSDYADLEFLSGWIALRFLGDPATALKHFKHLEAAVSTPISTARAHYWQGRALQAAGDTAGATAALRIAAQNQTAYYGLMAAETLGLNLDASLLSDSRPPNWQDASFTRSSVFAAAVLLEKAGDRTLAKRFFLHLSEGLNETEIAQLAQFALEIDEPHLAVVIAKQAAERGIILPRAYYPVPSFVPGEGLAVSRALALAISRRESEFDPAARSAADARGLMQVLPSTAKLVAPRVGLVYDSGNLNDPGYNVRIGTGYLAQLVEQFGPSVALVASGYNAGPGRPKRWIGTFGDPRDPSVDVVDWVEMIPFTETRTYVMRVTESLVIYRAKLKGVAGPVRITSELRG
ncbi:lytic transglycosylase domain-containing protein [Paragemmobacter straminiformis]|uniref:Lytic transglycosylase domain-containing protein n=1 Tax=Paragemmobacter straminiformis TaxID=2045119 RepID=A0A842IFG8_9RHOB|nr:lytic transglycosylase domain-containing protein [Gemmobacter straminiformis]MBC2837554.1 lytic transglycosylase domain-containing protein [Gemmobacter straminiformis]